MKVMDVVRFRNDLFFEGAVQLRWISDNPDRARRAAENFVFHGPRYHGVQREDAGDGYRLRDTASFVADLVDSFAYEDKRQTNPFSLAIAGYGSGKSHLAVTLATLLGQPDGEVAATIFGRVDAADSEIGKRCRAAMVSLKKPVLSVPLDGMSSFHLGTEITRRIMATLRSHGCNLAPVEELSPRFQTAEQFVSRNFALRRGDFSELLPDRDLEPIVASLRDHDEDVYSQVDRIFERANGARIPVEGQESIQDLIATVTNTYCGDEGPFSGLLILFDEFGRFLEYAGEKPHLAGDSALQQLFQGVQDSGGRARFLGFIQYELKAYIGRLDRQGSVHLQRYITRFEAANKLYLSTNLETLFAHLIEKVEPALIDRHLSGGGDAATAHHRFLTALPDAQRFPVWRDEAHFRQIIRAGCWPLDPLAVWFLTRQQDVVQSRSALNIVKFAFDGIANEPALSAEGNLKLISAADLLLPRDVLSEFVAADSARGGTVAETLQAILEGKAAHLDASMRRVLAAAAILLKLKVRNKVREDYQRVLGQAAGLSDDALEQALSTLTDELGVLAWNEDFGQFELIQDAATRGQFMRLLRAAVAAPAARDAGPIFATVARALCKLDEVTPPFANEHQIHTQDWRFEPTYASPATLTRSIANAFNDWRQASDVNEAKGRIVYVYVPGDMSVETVRSEARLAFSAELKRTSSALAPIWVILLHDRRERLADCLRRSWAVEHGFSDADKDRYRRFIAAEAERSSTQSQEAVRELLGERQYEVAGFAELTSVRLLQVGHEIFERVYPKVAPFPFDGFATGAGTGTPAKKDCLEIVRALIMGEFNVEWIQSRVPRLRNRATQVLISKWGVLDESGALKSVPREQSIAQALGAMNEWHQSEPKRSIEVTRRALLAPPFGFNTASVALLLALFSTGQRPRRRFLLDGQSVATSQWIGEALGTTDLNAKVLERTTVGYIPDDVHAQWKQLLGDWRQITRHQERLEFRRRAQSLARASAVPDEYIFQYQQLEEQAALSQQEIERFKGRFETIQKELEGFLPRGVSTFALASVDRLLAIQVEVHNGLWETENIEEADGLVLQLRTWLSSQKANWVTSVHCQSPQQVPDYRNRMQKAVQTYRRMELVDLASAVDQHLQQSIANVDVRFQFQRTINDARHFAQTTVVKALRTVAEALDVQAKVKVFNETLLLAQRQLGDPTISQLIADLNRRSEEAKQSIKDFRENLAGTYESEFDSTPTASALRERLETARDVFAGHRDQKDVEDAIKILDRIREDFAGWDTMEGAPEDLEPRLVSAMELRCSELEKWCSDESLESPFSLPEVYGRYRARFLAALRDRSSAWSRSMLPDLDQLAALPLSQCRVQQRALAVDAPPFLAVADRARLKQTQEALSERIHALEEQAGRSVAAAWIAQFEDVPARIDRLSRGECEQFLRQLRTRPAELGTDQVAATEQWITAIERRLDEMDISDIVSRIQRLKPGPFRELALFVADLFARTNRSEGSD